MTKILNRYNNIHNHESMKNNDSHLYDVRHINNGQLTGNPTEV